MTGDLHKDGREGVATHLVIGPGADDEAGVEGLDRCTSLIVVTHGGLGQTDHEGIVDGAAKRLGRCLHAAQRNLYVLQSAVTGAIVPQRGAPNGVTTGPGQQSRGGTHRRGRAIYGVDDAPCIRRPHHDFAKQPTTQANLAADEVANRSLSGRHQARCEVTADLCSSMMLNRISDDPLKVNLFWRCLIGSDLLIQLSHPKLANAVGDGVVGLDPQRTLAAGNAGDGDETPQRSRPIHRLGVQLGGEVQQLTVRTIARQLHLSDVVVEIKLGVRSPRRSGQAAEPRDDSLVQPRHVGNAVAQETAKHGHIYRPLQQGQTCPVRVEPRVLLNVPHERFVLRHSWREFHLPDRLGHGCHLRYRCRADGPTLRLGPRSSRAGRSP